MQHRTPNLVLAAISGALAIASAASADVVILEATYAPHIRNGTADTAYHDTSSTFVGRLSAGSWIRSLLDFDLSSIPDDAVINSVTLDLTISSVDTASATDFVGADGIRVYKLTESFNTAAGGVTWNERDNPANTAWTTAGGTFDPTPVSIIASPTDPDSVTVGEVFAFGSTSEFVGAVEGGLAANLLQLVVRTPTLESATTTRKIYRFGSDANSTEAYRPVLTVDYTLQQIPAPAALPAGLALLGLATIRRRA